MGKLLIIRGITGAGKSTIGKLLSDTGWDVKELDDLKLAKYETTEVCHPETDFPMFGALVGELLNSGLNVVAIEAFVEQEHVELFLTFVGKTIIDQAVRSVWLECDIETAMQRKSDILSQEVIEDQFRRIPGRYRVPGELEINTTRIAADVVFQAILEYCEK